MRISGLHTFVLFRFLFFSFPLSCPTPLHDSILPPSPPVKIGNNFTTKAMLSRYIIQVITIFALLAPALFSFPNFGWPPQVRQCSQRSRQPHSNDIPRAASFATPRPPFHFFPLFSRPPPVRIENLPLQLPRQEVPFFFVRSLFMQDPHSFFWIWPFPKFPWSAIFSPLLARCATVRINFAPWPPLGPSLFIKTPDLLILFPNWTPLYLHPHAPLGKSFFSPF